MKKILFILGTRPEGIKLAPLYTEIKKNPEFDVKLCSTGQHKEMLDQVLNFFNIEPDYKLNVMKPNQTLSGVTQAILAGLNPVLDEFGPDLVIVQGDTTTVLTGALGAFYRGIKVAHVEAGLRTWDIHTPFPEEANRVLVSKITDYHFAPTQLSHDNLIRDGINEENIFTVGNTVTDAIVLANSIVEEMSEDIRAKSFPGVDFSKKVILLTSHRRENLGEGLERICKSVQSLSERKDVEFVFPVHLNPKVRKTVNEYLGHIDNVHLIEPLDYPELVWIMGQCYMVMTDSGGIQEEAPSLGKPVLVLRESTERPEGIDAGTAVLVGTDTKRIVDVASRLLDNTGDLYDNMAHAVNPYGDGKCSRRISAIIDTNLQ